MDFTLSDLPVRVGREGKTRRLGLELEFAGIELQEAVRIVCAVTGGQSKQAHLYRYLVEADEGTYTIELDTRWADPDFVAAFAKDLPDAIRDDVVSGITEAAGNLLHAILPLELVCPPVPYDEADIVLPLARALAEAGALGTAHSAFSGFGMHYNIEVARLEVSYLLAITRAYLLLSFWLRRESRVSLIRHFQLYIEPFSEAYKRHVLQIDYAPSLEDFMDDHMRFNPTRNMELDLLPIFATLDEARVNAALPGIKNSARPTFHWRLPNCRIDEPDWHPLQDWERWVMVERLAADDELLTEFARKYLSDGPTTELEAQIRRTLDLLQL